jgi:hypothetical protein
MGTSLDGGKIITFSRSNARLERVGFSNVRDIYLVSLAPGAKHRFEGRNMAVELDLESDFVALSGRTSVVSQQFLLGVAKRLAELATPEYGIGFTRNENLSPTAYVRGFESGPVGYVPDTTEEAVTHLWRYHGMKIKVWRQGIMRDLYPWNFLTAPHRNARVSGQHLEQWIQAGPHRGTLEPITTEMVVWKVPEEDIPQVRPVLWDAGILFDPSKYEPSHPPEHGMPLSAEEAFRQVFGKAPPGQIQVFHVDKQGPEPQIREVGAEELRSIQKGKKKK